MKLEVKGCIIMKKEKKVKFTFFQEFKKFISRGNIMDMAVGIIVGSSFTSIVNSLVNDIITPFLGIFSKDGFTGLYLGIWESGVAATDITLANGAVIAAGEPIYRTYIYYGSFIQTIVNFLVIAFSVFCIVRIVNRLYKTVDEAADKVTQEIKERIAQNKEEKEEVTE